MEVNQEVKIPIGFYLGSACRVYEYYNPENEVWMKGLNLIVL